MSPAQDGLGDKPLQEVTYTILFGSEWPAVIATPPLGGILVEDVTMAAVLLTLALEELAHIVVMAPQPRPPTQNLLSSKIFKYIQSALQAFRDEHEGEWIQFSNTSVTLSDHWTA
ncbi:unnamed protein product [Cyclocybe aegerita]|uniref:Uncharacterized protein n=1 Tax=Cyclocybe aegerita TaxID=1973307 RepID=A0A8S0X115_CYCAE|nr:unnamed protein product [Cyclocybe aegerita]